MSPAHDPNRHSSGVVAAVPVIRGTRVPLWTLTEYFRNGRGIEAFLADYPQVTPAQVNQAIIRGLEALVDRRIASAGRARGEGRRPSEDRAP